MAQEGSTSTDVKDGKRRCKLCQITLPDIYAYTDHLESKEHTKSIMKNKYGEKYLEAKAELNEKIAKRKVEKKIDSEASDDSDEGECFTCEVCEKICTGIVSYKLHLSGKKHLKNVKAAKILKSMQKERILPENSRETEENPLLPFTENVYKCSELLCEICNKKCSGVASFKQHMQSETHKKKVAKQKLSEEILAEQKPKGEARDSAEDDSEDGAQDLFARCDICLKTFSGPVPYQQHMESVAHIKQTRQAKKMTKLKKLYTNTDDDKKIQCNECNKFFNGLKPFEEHLKSTMHQKLKKKNNLIKDLQEKYKEMSIRPSSILQLDSDDSDDGTVIYCEVCHTVFSGPESAWDHFQSPKHKKVLKEKLRYEKIKLLKKGKKSSSKSNITGESLASGENEDEEDSDESFDVIG